MKQTHSSRRLSAKRHPGPPWFLLWFWHLLDQLICHWLKIKPLREDGMGIISVEIRRHRGQAVRLDDGTIITSGRLLIELHMNNDWFLRNRGTAASVAGEVPWRASSAFAEDLGYLAEQLAEGKFPPEVGALHGVTTLHLPAQRFGFTITELPPGLRQRLVTFYLSGLRRAYYFGEGEEYTRRPPTLREVWMSKSRLLDRYGRRV